MIKQERTCGPVSELLAKKKQTGISYMREENIFHDQLQTKDKENPLHETKY